MEGSPSKRRKTPISNQLVLLVGVDIGLTTLFRKNTHVTEPVTEEINTIGCDGLLESSKDTGIDDGGESRKETTDRKVDVVSAKTKTRIGFWNV